MRVCVLRCDKSEPVNGMSTAEWILFFNETKELFGLLF